MSEKKPQNRIGNFNDKLIPPQQQTFASRDLGSWTETDQSRIIKKYKSTLEGAVSLLNRIKSLDRNQDAQIYFNENSRAIREHYEQSKKYDVKEYMNYTPSNCMFSFARYYFHKKT